MLANAKPLDPAGPPLFTVKRGRAVTLAIRNTSGHPHVMHLHGHSARVLDRLDDGWKPFWMDTLVVGDQIERIAFVADNPGKWLISVRNAGAAGRRYGGLVRGDLTIPAPPRRQVRHWGGRNGRTSKMKTMPIETPQARRD